MQIQSNRNGLNFTALHIASAGNLELYKIVDCADRKYLKTLPDKVDINKLMPDLSNPEAERWHEMVEYASDMAQDSDNITYLEALNNKPCGIITFFPDNKKITLDCICTWPLETGKKIYLAGKTLFYQLFKDFSELNGKKIELEAITDGPSDTIKKYSELGFKATSKVYPTKTVMEANVYNIKPAFAKLENLVDYTAVDPEKINLSRELN